MANFADQSHRPILHRGIAQPVTYYQKLIYEHSSRNTELARFLKESRRCLLSMASAARVFPDDIPESVPTIDDSLSDIQTLVTRYIQERHGDELRETARAGFAPSKGA